MTDRKPKQPQPQPQKTSTAQPPTIETRDVRIEGVVPGTTLTSDANGTRVDCTQTKGCISTVEVKPGGTTYFKF